MIPESGRCPVEGNRNPFQYFCLENHMERATWQATVHGATRIGRDLATKPPPRPHVQCGFLYIYFFTPQCYWTSELAMYFLVYAFVSSMQKIMAPTDRDNFTPFPIWMSSMSFSCSIIPNRISSTILNKSGECKHWS